MSKRGRTVAQVISLLSFTAITTSVVAADAITGTPSGVSTTDVAALLPALASVEGEMSRGGAAKETADQDADRAAAYQVAGTTLFDVAGSSLLVISASQSIDLFAPREKLRGVGHGSGGLIPDGVITGLGSGVPSASIGNVSFNAGGNPVGSNPAGAAPVAAPEPSSLILLGSGIAIVARRVARAHHQRRTA